MINYRELCGEKEVEHFWWETIHKFFPNCSIQARETGSKTDGLLIDEENKIRTLIEVKENLDLKNPFERAKVLMQSIFYIKKYEIAGESLPKAVFVADKNEAFVLHTNCLTKYLDYVVDWKIPASKAYTKYNNMLIDIANDEQIKPFVFDLPEIVNFEAIRNKLIDLNQNVKKLIKITDENIQQVFGYFLTNVLSKSKLNINEQVSLFIDFMFLSLID